MVLGRYISCMHIVTSYHLPWNRSHQSSLLYGVNAALRQLKQELQATDVQVNDTLIQPSRLAVAKKHSDSAACPQNLFKGQRKLWRTSCPSLAAAVPLVPNIPSLSSFPTLANTLRLLLGNLKHPSHTDELLIRRLPS